MSFLLLSGCGEKDTDPSSLFAKMAIVSYGDDLTQKFEFENDGTNYTRLSGFYDNGRGGFDEEPDFMFDIIYNGNNELIETRFVDETNAVSEKYVFEITSNSLKRTFLKLNESTGDFEESGVHEEFYLKDPEDGYYIFNEAIYEYKDGNMTGYGTESTDNTGNLDALEKNWNFYTYVFDNKPNVLTNYAINYAISDEFFERSRNKNNVIGFQWDSSNTLRTWTLNIDGAGRLMSFIHNSTGRTTTFEY
jgi:hypothetical protein